MNLLKNGNSLTFYIRLAGILFTCLPTVIAAQELNNKDTLQLNEVEVYGKSVNFYPTRVIPAKTFEGIAIRDIGDFLRQETNVSGIRKGGIGIDPVVRGFKYNQVTVLLNSGVKIEGGCPNRMDPVASHVESENIKSMEIIKGPYVLKYGPVLGALINVETNLPHPYAKPEIHAGGHHGGCLEWRGKTDR